MIKSIYEKVGTTAFVIAEWRAEENEKAAPLFCDHLANIFLNNETKQIAAKIASASPSTRFLVRFRTRYFDDQILLQQEQGVKQFIILGSGLDTRSIRLAKNGIKFFEVEQKHVLNFKDKQLKKFGYDNNSIYVCCDYTNVDFVTMLEKKGFDRTLKTFILWEGNVFYLTYQHICDVLNILNSQFEQFEITFDYLSKKLISLATGFKKSENLLNGFSSIGAQWQTGLDDIKELVRATDLKIIKDFLIADYINQISNEYEIDTQLFDDYFICALNRSKV